MRFLPARDVDPVELNEFARLAMILRTDTVGFAGKLSAEVAGLPVEPSCVELCDTDDVSSLFCDP